MGSQGLLRLLHTPQVQGLRQAPPTVARVVEEAVDDVEEEDQEAQQSQNGVWVNSKSGQTGVSLKEIPIDN